MDNEILIRAQGEPPAPQTQTIEPRATDADEPTSCGLTRKELRAIVAEIIG